jgi:RNA polymerase sporulation-specific sigma factor
MPTRGDLDGTALQELADADLVLRAQDGDQLATEELIGRYRGAVRARANNYFLAGGDRDDLCQEGYIGLTKAIRDFDTSNGASFAAFADLCITRQMLTAIKTATRLKHAPLNSYVSFERPDDTDPGQTVADVIAIVEAESDPLEALVADDDVRQLMTVVDQVLSSLEARVLRLYVDGRSYQEIAQLLGREAKSIDNALQRIKRKLETALHAA